MQVRTSNRFFGALSLALAIFGFWSFWTNIQSIPAPLHTASGIVSSAEASKRRGNISNIRFSLGGTPAEFSYSSILPKANDAWAVLDLGATASVTYTGTADDPTLWGLVVNGNTLISPDQVYRARRQNGYWALALGVIFTLSGSYLLLKRQ